eukprot:CAMPEP_0184496282 /NCGR_PEP_ID=MMETSP0113_2-20130426/33553_1 /TAXON_ID=91329 /ORGANISM="Norrisiella sphaerica, Strain BC52" /LENGTH=646 /DNA_ID=CAMNT_0026882843 /DNA_START=84 /DNA_END=2024 /DNA_ORIENTATION=+
METKGFSSTKVGTKVKEVQDGTKRLELLGVIGLNGRVPSGMILHPDDEHIIFPLGSTIVVKHVTESKQYFLQEGGHDREVSCMSLSKYGTYLASGQQSYMGFKAPIVLWNMETCEAVHKLVLHKGEVKDLCISDNEKFLVSLGGRDDNTIVVWDIETGEAICGASSANQTSMTVRWLSGRSDVIISAGNNNNARIWSFDHASRKLVPHQISLGSQRRNFISAISTEDAKTVYLGTTSGDVFDINVESKLFKGAGPANRKKNLFGKGIVSMICTRQVMPGHIIIGAGDGTVAMINTSTMKVVRKVKLVGGATSLSLNAAGDHFFVGTDKSMIYLVAIEDFEHELRTTCNYNSITDVAFPEGFSQLFATCSNEVRIWNSKQKDELLRIEIPNLKCQCVTIAPDGKSIVTGWEDGKIRAFKPKSGKLIYSINDAHRNGVTAISMTNDSKRIVSGGAQGNVRIWKITPQTQSMVASMKQHKGRVNSIQVDESNNYCVTAAADGSCIIWDLNQYNRDSCLFATTQFKSAVYHPDQSQLLTTGTDRKITFWDVVGSSEIRIIESSKEDVNSLAISPDGEWFVSGGNDRIVRLWGYDDGEVHYVGKGHSGHIQACKISPDQSFIVTVGSEGAIFMWKMPEDCLYSSAKAEAKR